MTYSDGINQLEIDINGNEIPIRKPQLRIPSQSDYYNNNLEDPAVDPYTEFPHCNVCNGIRLLERNHKKNIWQCPSCGNHFTVSKNRK